MNDLSPQVYDLLQDVIRRLKYYDMRLETIEAELTRIPAMQKRIDTLELQLDKYEKDTERFRVLVANDDVYNWFTHIEKDLAGCKTLINTKLGVTDEERYAAYNDQ